MVTGTEPTGFDWLSFTVDAIASTATLAAVIVAIVLGLHEVRKFRREEAERERERARRELSARREQAERVAGWLKFHPLSPYEPEGQVGRYADVISASAGPVYDVKVHVHSTTPKFVVREAGMIPPGETSHVHLPPESERPAQDIGAHIAFRDAGGRWWQRDDEGHLIEHDSDPWTDAARVVPVRHGHD